MTNVRFILNRPRNPNNIGAAARGMANFGFRHLAVVNPYSVAWRETRAAVHAHEVVAKAKKFKTIKAAIARCHLIIGTSAASRRGSGGKWIGPEELRKLVLGGIKKKKSIAILFGSENSGLSNEDLDYCHYIAKLPTSPDCPSMNLAQAVAVVAYVVRGDDTEPAPAPLFPELTANELDQLIKRAFIAFKKANLLKSWDEKRSEGRLRKMFNGWNLNQMDVAMLHILFRWVIAKADH